MVVIGRTIKFLYGKHFDRQNEGRVQPVSSDALRILLESVPDGFFVHDETGRFLDANAQSCRDLGYPREELLALTISDISCGADAEDNARRWADAPIGLAETFREIAVRKDGSTFPVEISVTCQSIEGRKLFFGLARDVSDREAAFAAVERQVAERTAALGDALEKLTMAARVGGLGIWDYDIDRDAMTCDEQWYQIMGRDPAQPVHRIAEFRAFIHPEDVDFATEVHQTAAQLAEQGQDYGIAFRIIRPDGSIRWLRSAARVLDDGAGRPTRAIGFVVDITDSWLAERQLEQSALEDPLTGLANRRRFDEALHKASLHATRTGEPVSLAMIDVDFFKLYNDSEGHVRGDEALKAIADILRSVAQRPHDLAARFGGEEFLLLLPGTDVPEVILQRMVQQLADLGIAHPTSPVSDRLTVSWGCVIVQEMADSSPIDLLAACDRALYAAKQAGRNRGKIFRD